MPGFARFAQRPRSGLTLQTRAQVQQPARFFFFLPGFLRGGSRTFWSAATRAAAGGPGSSPGGGRECHRRLAAPHPRVAARGTNGGGTRRAQQAVTAVQAERAAEPGASRAERRREGCGGRRSRPASAGWSEAEPGAARPGGHAPDQPPGRLPLAGSPARAGYPGILPQWWWKFNGAPEGPGAPGPARPVRERVWCDGMVISGNPPGGGGPAPSSRCACAPPGLRAACSPLRRTAAVRRSSLLRSGPRTAPGRTGRRTP